MSKGNGAGSTLLRMLQKVGGQYLEVWQLHCSSLPLKQKSCRSQSRPLHRGCSSNNWLMILLPLLKAGIQPAMHLGNCSCLTNLCTDSQAWKASVRLEKKRVSYAPSGSVVLSSAEAENWQDFTSPKFWVTASRLNKAFITLSNSKLLPFYLWMSMPSHTAFTKSIKKTSEPHGWNTKPKQNLGKPLKSSSDRSRISNSGNVKQ